MADLQGIVFLGLAGTGIGGSRRADWLQHPYGPGIERDARWHSMVVAHVCLPKTYT
jgi:hypothetical protein